MLPAQLLSVHTVADSFTAFMPELLTSLENQTSRDWQWLVIDNATAEGAGDLARHPQAAVLRNGRRLSWTKANNQAIALALSRWKGKSLFERVVFFVSPRIVLSPELLARLALSLAEDQSLMIACPKLLAAGIELAADETRALAFTSTIMAAGGLLTRGRTLIWRAAGEPDSEIWSAASEIFTPHPDIFAVRASALLVLSETGPWFDERFSSFAAVLDLAWRLRLAGGRSAVFGDVLAWRQTLSETAPVPAHGDDELLAVMAAAGLSDLSRTRARHLPWIFWERLALLAHPRLLWSSLGFFARNLARSRERRARLKLARVSAADMADWFV